MLISILMITHQLIKQTNPINMKKQIFQTLKNTIKSNAQTHTIIRPFCTSQQHGPSPRVNEIVNELMNLTLLESADLTEVMRKKMSINEMPIMAVMMRGMGLKTGVKGAGEKAKEKEKSVFDLKLEGGYDAGSKIKIIKEVRSFTDLDLKEPKELVEKALTLLKKGVGKDEAEKIIEKMKGIGPRVVME